jgi:hypothetical protein
MIPVADDLQRHREPRSTGSESGSDVPEFIAH